MLFFQIANVAALPGIVGKSVGLPDIHSGYGFAIGNMAAFDCGDPKAVVSPGLATLDQIFSVDFSKSRIDVKSAFSTNAQSRFASVVVDVVLGPPRLARHT